MTRGALAAIATVACLAAPAAAQPSEVTGVVFVAQPVRAPVRLDQVSAVAPFVPADIAERSGAVEVGPGAAAAVWLDALDVVRVRYPAGAPVRFARIVGRGRINEPGVPVAAGESYLAQPPGRGDAWVVWASRPTRIQVERPIARDARLRWDEVHGELLAWVDRGGPQPALPVSDGAYGVARAIAADAVIGAALVAREPAVARGVAAWRKAGVVGGLLTARPMIAPQLAISPLDDLAGFGGDVTVPDPGATSVRPYHRVRGPRTIAVELDGPGLLRVEARAVLPAPAGGVAIEPPPVAVAVSAAGRRLARRGIAASYAVAPTLVEPPPAFPDKQPLRASEGDFLGDRVAVSVALFPGRHRYAIALEGGDLAVRATTARRRVRLGEALAHDDADAYLAAAAAALPGARSPTAELVRRLIALRAGEVAAAAPVPAGLPPLLALAWHATAPAPDLAAVRAVLGALPWTTGPEVWALVLELARRLPPDDVRAVYRAVHGAPPPSLVPELTALLPRATPLERIRNWPLAAVDSAARAVPLDPAVAAASRAAWRGGEWALVAPTLRDPDADPPAARRWLVETRPLPLTPPRAWRAGDLTRLVPGTPRVVTALPSAIDAGRAALLDIHVAAAAGDAGPIEVRVDGVAFRSYALAAVERLQIAVAPGTHRVELVARPGLRGWVSQLPAGPVAATDSARIQHYWPVALDGERLSYALPAGDLPIPVEIAARVLGGAPVKLVVRGDLGAAIELVLDGGAADATAIPADRAPVAAATPGAAGEEVRTVVRLPPGTRKLWFETADPARVVVAVSARRERTAAPAAAAPRAPAAADLVERVATASRALARDPDDPRIRARRASDLLDLGEAGLAREDLIALLRTPAARREAATDLAALEEELFARLDNFSEPTHVALVAGTAGKPVALAPALLAIAEPAALATWQRAATALRTQGPAAALAAVGERPDDPVAAYLAARALEQRGDLPAAGLAYARLLARTAAWQVGFEAIDVLARVVSDRDRAPPPGLLALTYGIAARLRTTLDHPRVRRALVVAAAQTGWDTLTSVSTSAGQEHLFASTPALPPAPAVVTREAMVSPPWPVRSAHTLTAGNAAVLDLAVAGTARVRAQIHCARLRGGARAAPCVLSAKIDGGEPRPLAAPVGETVDLPLDELRAGRHLVEVALAAANEGDVASVRFVSDRALGALTAPAEGGAHPIRIDRRAKVFVAAQPTPITATVLGPTTLWLQARALAPGPRGPRRVEVIATPRQGPPVSAVLALPATIDADARGEATRALAVSAAADAFLVLPEAGPYAIAVRPDRGELVGRLALRDERRGKIPRLPGPWYAAAPQPAAPFALPTPPAIARITGAPLAPPAAGRFGTVSVEVTASQDHRPDEDLSDRGLDRNSERVFARAETALSYRRALAPGRAWIGLRGVARTREATALVLGGRADLYADDLPLGTTLQLAATSYTQAYSAGRALHVRGDLRLSRRFDASDTVAVIPGVGFAASYLNTTPEIAATAMDEVDPDVYNDYRDAHDLAGTGRLTIRWQPFQDVVGAVGAYATTNADFGGLDHAALTLSGRTLAPLPLLGETLIDLGYRPSYRFADADRAAAYTRHDLTARLEWTLWTGTRGRFVLALWDELLLGATTTRNAFGGVLRFDLTAHRGLADFAPDESPFPSLVECRCYAPLELR